MCDSRNRGKGNYEKYCFKSKNSDREHIVALAADGDGGSGRGSGSGRYKRAFCRQRSTIRTDDNKYAGTASRAVCKPRCVVADEGYYGLRSRKAAILYGCRRERGAYSVVRCKTAALSIEKSHFLVCI